MIQIIIISLMLIGCAIPLRITTYTNPKELERQEELRKEDISREIELRKQVKLEFERKLLKEESKKERNRILKILNKDQKLILKAFEKEGFDFFTTAKWLYNHVKIAKKVNFKSFCDYLLQEEVKTEDLIIQTKGPLNQKSGGRILESYFKQIEQSYNLLKELEKRKNEIK